MSRVRVKIDLNVRDANGLTRTRLKNASAPLHKGEIVTAYESEDQVQALAMVDRVDTRTGYAFLLVNWESICDDDGSEVMPKFHDARMVNRAQASVANRRAQNGVAIPRSANAVRWFADVSSTTDGLNSGKTQTR